MVYETTNRHKQVGFIPTCCVCRSQMMVLILLRISSMKGIASPTCTVTKCLLHFMAILINVSQAMSCTPSCVSETKGCSINYCKTSEKVNPHLFYVHTINFTCMKSWIFLEDLAFDILHILTFSTLKDFFRY